MATHQITRSLPPCKVAPWQIPIEQQAALARLARLRGPELPDTADSEARTRQERRLEQERDR